MTLERGQKKTRFQAQIGVNRGKAFDVASQQVAENNRILSNALTNYINYSYENLKNVEEQTGKELAKTTAINYKNYKYIDSDGIEQEVQVPVNYKTPEALLQTTFSANTYEEEMTERYVNSIMSSAENIIEQEKIKSKNNINPTMPLGNTINSFRMTTSEPLGALKESIPKELNEAFDLEIVKYMRRAETELGNTYIGNKKSYETTKTTFGISNLNDTLKFLPIQDPDTFEERVNKQVREIEILASHNNPKALAWISENKELAQEAIQFNKQISPYFNIDDSNEINVQYSFNNAVQFEMLLKGVQSSGEFYNFKTQQTEKLNLNDVLSSNKYSQNFRQTASNQATSVRQLLASRIDSIKSANDFSYKLDKSIALDRPYFTNSDKKKLRTQFDNPNSEEFKQLFQSFTNVYGETTMEQFVNDPEKQAQFYTYMGQATGVIPDSQKTLVLATLDQPDQESIKQLMLSSRNQIMFKNKYIDPKTNKDYIYNGINYLGSISEDQRQKLITLKNYLQSGLSPDRASIAFMEKYSGDFEQLNNEQILSKYNHIIPDASYGAKKISTLKNAIQEEILDQLAGSEFDIKYTSDPLIQGKLFQTIMDQTMMHFQYGQNVKSLTAIVQEEFDRFKQDGNITVSQFGVSQSFYNTEDFESDAVYLMTYAPERYIPNMAENKQKFVDAIQERMEFQGVQNLSDIQGGRLIAFAEQLLPENLGEELRLMPIRLLTSRPDLDQIYELVLVTPNSPTPLPIGMRFTMKQLKDINDN